MIEEKTTRDVQKPLFTTFEWVLLIVIIMLVLYVCQLHHRSIAAQSYISFTGTIVSIVVGVLAIVYAMLESTRQALSGKKLNDGAETIERAASELDAKLAKLDEVYTEIVNAKVELQQTSRKSADMIDTAMSQLGSKLDGIGNNQSEMVAAVKRLSEERAAIPLKNNQTSNSSEDVEFLRKILASTCKNSLSGTFSLLALVLATVRQKMYLEYSVSSEYLELTKNIDTDFYINQKSLAVGMGVLHKFLVDFSVIAVNQNDWFIYPNKIDILRSAIQSIDLLPYKNDGNFQTEVEVIENLTAEILSSKPFSQNSK